MLLAIEPEYEPATVVPDGVRLLGMDFAHTDRWPSLRHVFDLGLDAGLHVELSPLGHVVAYAVGYDSWGDELLTAL